MLKPTKDHIRQVAFVYAHCGLKEYKNNRIYSIAAAKIQFEKPIKKYDSLIQYYLLTERERYYSNVSKEMLLSAPNPEKVKTELREFLIDQNAIFFLNNHDNIDEVAKFCSYHRIIDLSFAGEFFLPHLDSYSPKRIFEYLSQKQRDKISFSASEIVKLSIDLIDHICSNQLNNKSNPQAAAIRYYLNKSNTLFGKAFIHITKNYQKYFGGLFNPISTPDTDNWRKFLERVKPGKRNKSQNQPLKKISTEKIESLFQGLSKSGKGYKYRPDQVEYARHVTNALNDNAIHCIEAGTGTGKTIGYLLPTLEFLHKNKDVYIAISTYTKNLQEQIFERDLFFVKDIFKIYKGIPVALLKGKSSYICSEKLNYLYEETLTGEKLLAWLYFVNIIYHFRSADIDSVGEKIKKYLNKHGHINQMINDISAKSDCGIKHIFCPAQVITAEARNSRLIITNHHKLALLGLDGLLSNLFRNYIIDEATHFEQAIRNAFRVEVSSMDIVDIIKYMEKTLKRVVNRSAEPYETKINKSIEGMRDLREEIIALRKALLGLNTKIGHGKIEILPYNHSVFKNGNLKYHIKAIRNELIEIKENLDLIKNSDTCRILKILSKTEAIMKLSLNKIDEFIESLKIIEENMTLQNNVATYQVFKHHWILNVQSVNVGELIKANIHEDKDTIIYTSATLTRNNNFNNFKSITGLDNNINIDTEATHQKEYRFSIIPSPFLKNAKKIIVPKEAVSGKFKNKEMWLNKVTEILPELIINNNGRTLVLFSSYNDLELIANRIANSIPNPLLIQQKGCPTFNLCDEFRIIKESVLFGVETFWYGVDFKGDTLTQIIITRIPYPSPNDPLQIARKKMSQKEYWSRYHYDTTIKIKQGIGRLIRCDTDRGKVVILDSRYNSKFNS